LFHEHRLPPWSGYEAFCNQIALAEELLDRYQLREQAATEVSDDTSALDTRHPSKRGRLRISLSMAAGVGKTFAILNEGRRRKRRGMMWSLVWWERMGAR
jgi:hypothetical protein